MKDYISGQYRKQKFHSSFQPSLINRSWTIDNSEVIGLLCDANNALGKLDMFSQYVPNIDLFIGMHLVKEATESSKIEGTQTNIEEALLERHDVALERRDDWEEVNNYLTAMRLGMKRIEELPFSSRLIKEIHSTLLQGVRGAHKLPDLYRTSQNWIGGASINDAVFVPPFQDEVEALMGDLENFANDENSAINYLLRIAIIHYQFETIHPFLDGNGRVGRLLIPLYLIEKGLLSAPTLYLSNFFENNRQLYYDNLMAVREKNDLTRWLKFFFVGIIETAHKGIKTFDGIMKLKAKTDEKLKTLGSRQEKADKVVNYLYQSAVITAPKLAELLGISLASSYHMIKTLKGLEVLQPSGEKGNANYYFKEYLALF